MRREGREERGALLSTQPEIWLNYNEYTVIKQNTGRVGQITTHTTAILQFMDATLCFTGLDRVNL